MAGIFFIIKQNTSIRYKLFNTFSFLKFSNIAPFNFQVQ